ncbi:MAG: HAMP domain-containing sensor histidine kinase [bacterium]|nr:HAMP domain-containing sensor histidine kinase [bacterium]
MNLNRTYLFILSSSVALLIVLLIQLNWILQTAHIKEELFNEKANMVLTRTAEALSIDSVTFNNLEVTGGAMGVRKVDSLFNHYMKLYNIHIDYYFKIFPTPFQSENKSGLTNFGLPLKADSFQQCVKEKSGKRGIDLKLIFPDKKQFIMEEMGSPFFASAILILVVGILFWRTSVSLLREKQISENTRNFLNNMTHEFRTPITNIALAGKMITKDGIFRQEDKIRHYSSIILEENEKLRLQVEEVLSMAALERGEIPLQKTSLDLHELIHHSVKCLNLQLENKQGICKVTLEAESHMILGDKTHLINALCNLIDNAIKYAKEKPKLELKSYNSGSQLLIAVSDNGPGIEKEFQRKVFEKFFRVPTGDVHDVKGFGLGLSYVRKIIELHGGNIELTSEVGKGATFLISLTYV